MYNDKRSAAKFAQDYYGLKAHFFKPEDVSAFDRILKSYGLRNLLEPRSYIDLNTEGIYTIHPPIDVPPIEREYQFRPCDRFGFKRLGLLHTLIRPHFNNVRSCHRLEGELKAPGGNLAYMGNPWWTTYAFYQDSNSQVQLVTGISGLLDEDLTGLPNLIATVNVLFGHDNRGRGSALISRVYGAVDFLKKDNKGLAGTPCLYRLVEYLQFKLGLRVYFHPKWLGTFHSLGGGALTPVANNTVTAHYIPNNINATNPQDYDAKCLVYRYPDIARPTTFFDKNSGILYVREFHEVVEVKEFLNNIPRSISSIIPAIGGCPFGFEGKTIAGYRPLRVDQYIVCDQCGVDAETQKADVQYYEGHGSLCANCASYLVVYSEWDHRNLLKETAVPYIHANNVEYISQESLAYAGNRFVNLKYPVFQLGISLIDQETAAHVNEVFVENGELKVHRTLTTRGRLDFVSLNSSGVEVIKSLNIGDSIYDYPLAVHLTQLEAVKEAFKTRGYFEIEDTLDYLTNDYNFLTLTDGVVVPTTHLNTPSNLYTINITISDSHRKRVARVIHVGAPTNLILSPIALHRIVNTYFSDILSRLDYPDTILFYGPEELTLDRDILIDSFRSQSTRKQKVDTSGFGFIAEPIEVGECQLEQADLNFTEPKPRKKRISKKIPVEV